MAHIIAYASIALLGQTPRQRIELSECVIEIVTVTPDHRPATVSFQFRKPLEDDEYRWVYWKTDRYEAFDLPSVGETIILPPPRTEWP